MYSLKIVLKIDIFKVNASCLLQSSRPLYWNSCSLSILKPCSELISQQCKEYVQYHYGAIMINDFKIILRKETWFLWIFAYISILKHLSWWKYIYINYALLLIKLFFYSLNKVWISKTQLKSCLPVWKKAVLSLHFESHNV